MNTFILYKIVGILVFMAFTFTPFTALATDIWSETPNLDDDIGLSSAVIKPTAFINSRPSVNMWAETPELNIEKEDYGFIPDDEGRFVSTFTPEMYVETPALDEIFIRRQLLEDVDSLLAEGR